MTVKKLTEERKVRETEKRRVTIKKQHVSLAIELLESCDFMSDGI